MFYRNDEIIHPQIPEISPFLRTWLEKKIVCDPSPGLSYRSTSDQETRQEPVATWRHRKTTRRPDHAASVRGSECIIHDDDDADDYDVVDDIDNLGVTAAVDDP